MFFIIIRFVDSIKKQMSGHLFFNSWIFIIVFVLSFRVEWYSTESRNLQCIVIPVKTGIHFNKKSGHCWPPGAYHGAPLKRALRIILKVRRSPWFRYRALPMKNKMT